MSESEEMYLVTIARLVEAGEEPPIPVSRLAAELQIAPVSVNQMVRKLEECGLVSYTPYRGVELSAQGQKNALSILRRRRLWEVFLAQHLAMEENEAAELACRLEHLVPEAAGERLAAYLGHPRVTPRGLPIPDSDLKTGWIDQPLSALCPPGQGVVTKLPGDANARGYLAAQGIRPGAEITVLAVGEDGALLVKTGAGITQVASELAGRIRVEQTLHA